MAVELHALISCQSMLYTTGCPYTFLRCVVIMVLCMWRSADWVMEQPMTSLLELHDRMQWFFQRFEAHV